MRIERFGSHAFYAVSRSLPKYTTKRSPRRETNQPDAVLARKIDARLDGADVRDGQGDETADGDRRAQPPIHWQRVAAALIEAICWDCFGAKWRRC